MPLPHNGRVTIMFLGHNGKILIFDATDFEFECCASHLYLR